MFVDASRVGGREIIEPAAAGDGAPLETFSRISKEEGDKSASIFVDGNIARPPQNRSRPWPSSICRNFLRELVASMVLKPVVDTAADPDAINFALLSLFYPSTTGIGISGGKEERQGQTDEASQNQYSIPFGSPTANEEIPTTTKKDDLPRQSQNCGLLESFAANPSRDCQDSFLGLKLRELVKDARLRTVFEQFLRDNLCSAHVLECFLQASDILTRIHALPLVLIRIKYFKIQIIIFNKLRDSTKYSKRCRNNSEKLNKLDTK